MKRMQYTEETGGLGPNEAYAVHRGDRRARAQ